MDFIEHPTGNRTARPKAGEVLKPRFFSLVSPDLIELHVVAALMPQEKRASYRADWISAHGLWRVVFTTPPGGEAKSQIEREYLATRRVIALRTTGKPPAPGLLNKKPRKKAEDYAAERAARRKKPPAGGKKPPKKSSRSLALAT
jgi:hypothetical protein